MEIIIEHLGANEAIYLVNGEDETLVKLTAEIPWKTRLVLAELLKTKLEEGFALEASEAPQEGKKHLVPPLPGAPKAEVDKWNWTLSFCTANGLGLAEGWDLAETIWKQKVPEPKSVLGLSMEEVITTLKSWGSDIEILRDGEEPVKAKLIMDYRPRNGGRFAEVRYIDKNGDVQTHYFRQKENCIAFSRKEGAIVLENDLRNEVEIRKAQ